MENLSPSKKSSFSLDSTRVTEIAEIVVDEMGLSQVEFDYTGGKRGWPGDVIRSQQ